jgi:cation diffusion facilitator family transporter
MTTENRTIAAKRITFIGLGVNIILTTAKLLAGIYGKSAAMLADGTHSLSDIITDFIVIAFVGIAGKESDHDHQYGHGKYETFATMLISFALMIVGIGIFWEGLSSVYNVFMGKTLDKPGMVALYAALISVVSKEILYRYTVIVGERTNNQAVKANAWHHRSDAFSSIGTSLGIGGAIFFGENWRVLDPIAGMVVSVFIMKVAFELGLPSIKELLETALPEEIKTEIGRIINSQNGVRHFHRLKTRQIGSSLAIEVHVKVDKDLTVEESHNIATAVEDALRSRFGKQTHVGVHIEPFYKYLE